MPLFDILTDLSAPALRRAVLGNLLEFFALLRRAPHTEYHADDFITRWHTRVPHPWFNGVLALQPPTADYHPIIEDTLAYFSARGVAPFTWWLSPEQSAADWTAYLSPFGFRPDRTTPGMAVKLSALPARVPAPPQLRIVPVADDATLKIWTHTFRLGYELPHTWEHNFYELLAGLGLEWPVRNYLGYVADEPVATSSLFGGAGVAGIQCVSTVPHWRGHGLGAALTLHALQQAGKQGYLAGILQSSAMGFNVYRRLGFETVCDVAHFYWRPADDAPEV